MSTPSVLRSLAHLPWIGAGIVLLFGLAFWSLRPAPADVTPRSSEQPAFHLDEAGFRKLIETEAGLDGVLVDPQEKP